MSKEQTSKDTPRIEHQDQDVRSQESQGLTQAESLQDKLDLIKGMMNAGLGGPGSIKAGAVLPSLPKLQKPGNNSATPSTGISVPSKKNPIKQAQQTQNKDIKDLKMKEAQAALSMKKDEMDKSEGKRESNSDRLKRIMAEKKQRDADKKSGADIDKKLKSIMGKRYKQDSTIKRALRKKPGEAKGQTAEERKQKDNQAKLEQKLKDPEYKKKALMAQEKEAQKKKKQDKAYNDAVNTYDPDHRPPVAQKKRKSTYIDQFNRRKEAPDKKLIDKENRGQFKVEPKNMKKSREEHLIEKLGALKEALAKAKASDAFDVDRISADFDRGRKWDKDASMKDAAAREADKMNEMSAKNPIKTYKPGQKGHKPRANQTKATHDKLLSETKGKKGIKMEVTKADTKLMDSVIDHIRAGKKTGIPYIDAGIADATGETRMALPKEKQELKDSKKKKAKDEVTGKEKKAASDMEKSGYKGYTDADNARRKSKNLGEDSGTGIHTMKRVKKWGGSGINAVNREAAEMKRKSAKNPVKEFSAEEIAAYEKEKGMKKSLENLLEGLRELNKAMPMKPAPEGSVNRKTYKDEFEKNEAKKRYKENSSWRRAENKIQDIYNEKLHPTWADAHDSGKAGARVSDAHFEDTATYKETGKKPKDLGEMSKPFKKKEEDKKKKKDW